MPKSSDFWEHRLELVNLDIVEAELDLTICMPLKNPRLPLVLKRRKGEVWDHHRLAWRRQVRLRAALKRRLAKLIKRKAYIEERLKPKSVWEHLMGKPII